MISRDAIELPRSGRRHGTPGRRIDNGAIVTPTKNPIKERGAPGVKRCKPRVREILYTCSVPLAQYMPLVLPGKTNDSLAILLPARKGVHGEPECGFLSQDSHRSGASDHHQGGPGLAHCTCRQTLPPRLRAARIKSDGVEEAPTVICPINPG